MSKLYISRIIKILFNKIIYFTQLILHFSPISFKASKQGATALQFLNLIKHLHQDVIQVNLVSDAKMLIK